MTEEGGKNWYIVYPDYAFGQDMTKSFTAAVKRAGGTVVSRTIATPFPNDNFSTFTAQGAGLTPSRDVLGTMQAGGDLVNLVKQYNQFELQDKGIGLAVGLMFITDIHSPRRRTQFAGTTFTDAWYWNFDAAEPAWADKFKAKTGTRPSFAHAGNYSAATQYLEAVQAAGTDDVRRRRQAARGQEVQRRVPAQRRDPRRGPPRHPRRLPGQGQAARTRSRRTGTTRRSSRPSRPTRRSEPAVRPRQPASWR